MTRLLLAALVAILAQPASAFEDFLPLYETAKPVKVERAPVRKAKAKKPKPRVVRKAKPAPAEPTRVLAAEYRTEDVTRCLSPVRVVGSQWATQDGAEESARKSWSEEVRFSSGESFMDLNTAQNYRRRCTRSSIGEIAGQTLHRCEIEATPCRPGLMEVSK